jgi:hypothetical protein
VPLRLPLRIVELECHETPLDRIAYFTGGCQPPEDVTVQLDGRRVSGGGEGSGGGVFGNGDEGRGCGLNP